MGRSGVHLDTANEWKIHTNAIDCIYGHQEAAGIKMTSPGRDHSIRGNVFNHIEYGISLDTGAVNLGMNMADDARRRGLAWPPRERKSVSSKAKAFKTFSALKIP